MIIWFFLGSLPIHYIINKNWKLFCLTDCIFNGVVIFSNPSALHGSLRQSGGAMRAFKFLKYFPLFFVHSDFPKDDFPTTF